MGYYMRYLFEGELESMLDWEILCRYSALTTKGREVKGVVEAADKMAAIHAIREQGLIPAKVRGVGGR